MFDTVRSLQFSKARSAKIIRTKKAEQKEGYLTIKSLYSLISNGTENLVYQGKVPKSCYQSMRLPLMLGSFDFPLIYGYSLVGKVIEGDDHLLNKKVHLLNPHQDYVQVKKEHCFVLAKELPAKRATLLSHMETVINAIWDSQLSLGDRVLVMGYGLLGGLIARTLKEYFALDLAVFDINPKKMALAKEHGLNLDDSPREYDCCFHVTSSVHSLNKAIASVCCEGKVVELNWYGDQEVSLNLGSSFHYERKKIISSQVSNIPMDKKNRWDFLKRKKLAARLLLNEKYDEYLTDFLSFEEAPNFYKRLEAKSYHGIACCLSY